MTSVADLTIDELARATGFTVRNVRNHQTRGILHGPRMEGRVGYYDERHVERLQLIRRLQEDGMSLRAVENLLATRGETADRMNALRLEVLSQLSRDRTPERLPIEQVQERFGPFGPEVVELALELNAVTLDDEGTFVIDDPALLGVLEQAAEQGLSLESALTAAVEVQRLCERAAGVFVELIRHDVWAPFDEAGQPEDGWASVQGSIERVRPLASQIFSLMLPSAIDERIDKVFNEEIGKQADVARSR